MRFVMRKPIKALTSIVRLNYLILYQTIRYCGINGPRIHWEEVWQMLSWLSTSSEHFSFPSNSPNAFG